MTDYQTNPIFPWQPASPTRGNLAIGTLRNMLLGRLTTEIGSTKKGIHAETILAAVGTLTGFAAQHAALVNGAAATAQTGSVPLHSVTTVCTQPEAKPFC